MGLHPWNSFLEQTADVISDMPLILATTKAAVVREGSGRLCFHWSSVVTLTRSPEQADDTSVFR